MGYELKTVTFQTAIKTALVEMEVKCGGWDGSVYLNSFAFVYISFFQAIVFMMSAESNLFK
jgi:hypothetical protein